jgi:hypothetical protein
MFVGKRLSFEEESNLNTQYDLKRCVSRSKQPISLVETIKSQHRYRSLFKCREKAMALCKQFPSIAQTEIHRIVETLEGNLSLAKDILLNQQEENERQFVKK